jgi:ATP-binding cassette subfamily B protein
MPRERGRSRAASAPAGRLEGFRRRSRWLAVKARITGLAPQRLQWLLGDRLGIVAMLTGTALLTGFCEAGILAIFAELAAALVAGRDSVDLEVGPLNMHPGIDLLLAIALALSLVRIALAVSQSLLPPQIAANVQAKLRRELLSAFMAASWDVQSRDREGHLQEVMTSQSNQASQAAVAATTLIGSVLTFLVLIATALLLSPLAVLVMLIMSVVLFGILQPLRAHGRKQAQALSGAQMEFANAIGEANRMIEETQVFGVGARQVERVDAYVERARGLFVRTQATLRLVPSLYQSVLYLLMVGGLALIYFSGASKIASLGAVVLLLVRAGTYGQAVQNGHQTIQQAMPFVDRVLGLAQRYEENRPPAGERKLARVSTIAFDHVRFGYRPQVPVLKDISFEVEAGESIGIVGPSGAGKSSAVQILLRLREPTGGSYLVNGRPAAAFAREDWQQRVGYVSQEPHLLHATVAENIRYFRDLDDAAVEEAAGLAHIHTEIEGWSDGYETVVGPRADAVSGGQEQRLCLARALAGKPDILILDEPTSALDPRSEALVRRSLAELKHRMTIFVIAHGPALLDICDRAMVIVDGRLEAFDSIAALAEASTYQRSIEGLGFEVFREKIA